MVPVLGQQPVIDSLENALKNHPADDSSKLTILSNLSFYYSDIDPDLGFKYAEQEMQLAKKIKVPKHEAEALTNKALNHWAIGEYDTAIKTYQKAGAIYKQYHFERECIIVLGRLGVVYYSSSDYSKALDLYWECLKGFEKMGDLKQVAKMYGNIALCYANLEKNDKAIQYYRKAIQINIQLGDEKAVADNYTNFGNLYDNILMSDTALYYYKKALEISRRIGYNRNVASNTTNMGIALTTKKNFSEAYGYLLEGLEFYRKTGIKRHIAVIYKSIADVMLHATPTFFSEKKLDLTKRYAYTKNYLDSSYALYLEMEDPSGQGEVWMLRSLLDSAQNNFKSAYESYKQFTFFKDIIFNDEKNQEVATLEMSYAFSKKEDSIRSENEQMALAASAEIKRQSTIKTATIIASAIFFIAAITSFLFYKRKRDAVEKQQEAEFKTEVTETEMKALRAQMNPHFIFNSLNSISDYISKNNIPEADRYLSKFAKLMRLILENSEKKEIPLKDDLRALELYMMLESLRMKHKFTHSIIVDETINPETTLVPPLILQPFVENAIWHGIAGKEGNGKITIRIQKEAGERMHCIVEDDGVGRKKSAEKNNTTTTGKSSLGMKITQARIDVLNKTKNANAGITFTDLEPGLRVTVTLPLITSNEI
ncbi:MAG: tetratricopeptide repeat protein [Bacteroidetes bacterium]|nr:tetratricopeptide repeat protein [Bacteroidota bacterium]